MLCILAFLKGDILAWLVLNWSTDKVQHEQQPCQDSTSHCHTNVSELRARRFTFMRLKKKKIRFHALSAFGLNAETAHKSAYWDGGLCNEDTCSSRNPQNLFYISHRTTNWPGFDFNQIYSSRVGQVLWASYIIYFCVGAPAFQITKVNRTWKKKKIAWCMPLDFKRAIVYIFFPSFLFNLFLNMGNDCTQTTSFGVCVIALVQHFKELLLTFHPELFLT